MSRICLCIAIVISSHVWAATAPVNNGDPVLPVITVEDQLLKTLNDVGSLTEMVQRLAGRMLPGDDQFLVKKINSVPDLKTLKHLPKVSIDHGVFVVQNGTTDLSVHLNDADRFEFDINRQKVVILPSALAVERWLRIGDNLSQSHASVISFLPVAFALEGGAATYSSVMAMAITSVIARGHATAYNVRVRSESVSLPYTDVWKKIIQNKSICTNRYLQVMAQKMAELQVSELRCEELPNKSAKGFHLSGKTIFEIPVGDGASKRVLTLDPGAGTVQEQAPDLAGKPMLYRRVQRADSTDDAAKGKVVRKKGMMWQPVGNPDLQFVDRSEQFRELADEAFSTDLCHRCGVSFRNAIREFIEDDKSSVDKKSPKIGQ